jgi:hypothetical protein
MIRKIEKERDKSDYKKDYKIGRQICTCTFREEK